MSETRLFNVTPMVTVAAMAVFLLSRITPSTNAVAAQWAMVNGGIAYCTSTPHPGEAPNTENFTVWWKAQGEKIPQVDALTVSREEREIVHQVSIRSDLATSCPGYWQSLIAGYPEGSSAAITPWYNNPDLPPNLPPTPGTAPSGTDTDSYIWAAPTVGQ